MTRQCAISLDCGQYGREKLQINEVMLRGLNEVGYCLRIIYKVYDPSFDLFRNEKSEIFMRISTAEELIENIDKMTEDDGDPITIDCLEGHIKLSYDKIEEILRGRQNITPAIKVDIIRESQHGETFINSTLANFPTIDAISAFLDKWMPTANTNIQNKPTHTSV